MGSLLLILFFSMVVMIAGIQFLIFIAYKLGTNVSSLIRIMCYVVGIGIALVILISFLNIFGIGIGLVFAALKSF